MTEDEAKVFLVMLEQAAQEFSNHGCNDFDVGEMLTLPKRKAEEVAKALRLRMVADEILDPEAAGDQGPYLYDWTILSWLKRKIQRAMSSPV